MHRSCLLCLLPLVVSVTEQLSNDGIRYDGTSNVRYQKTYPPLLSFPGRSESIPISTTTDSPPSTVKTAPPTIDVPKISQVNVTTSSGPIYIPRQKPFLLPRRTGLGSRPKQQATQTLAVVESQPKLFVDTQSTELVAPPPSVISVFQPSVVSAPQLVIQVISGPQTPINTTLETSTIEMPVLNADGSTTLTAVPTQQVPTVTVSPPKASPVAVQPKKEPVSFGSKPDDVPEIESMSPLQEKIKLELNSKPAQEQDRHTEEGSILKSTPNSFKSDQYPIKMRPLTTFLPILDSVSVEEPDTTLPPLLEISEITEGTTTETSSKVEPVAGTVERPLISTNLSSVNSVNLLPIINATLQSPTVTEIQPPLVTTNKLPLTETQVITAPHILIQLIADPKQPLNTASAIYHPDVTSVQLNRTTDLQLPTTSLSLNTPKISEAMLQHKTETAFNVTDPEVIVESEFVPQLKPEPITQPEPEPKTQPEPEPTTQREPEPITQPEPEPTTQPEPITQPEPELTPQPEPEPTTQSETTDQPTFQSLPNIPTPEQISYALKIKLKGKKLMEEYTMVPLLTHRGDAIAEPSFTFEIPVNATNQTIVTAKSQPTESASTQSVLATSQPSVMTPSPQPTVTTTIQESVVIAKNNQPKAVSVPQVIIQLTMAPHHSLSAAPQLPVSPSPKLLSVTATTSRITEIPQKADQPGLFSVSEISGSKSELGTPQESKQDARPNSESHFESETTFEPEVEISSKPYSYPTKLRPQISFVAVPDSAWKHVVLKPQPAVLSPLLPRPNPSREPDYGRPSQSTTQFSTKVTQNTIEVPSNNISTSKRLGSFNFDFVCNDGNGYYTVDNECNTYILCQQNQATKFSCPDGLYFNPAAKFNEYPCVYPSEVQCIGSTGKLTEELGNGGIGYYGTSNVRYQKQYSPLLLFSGRSQSIPISTTTDNPPTTAKTASPSVDVPKINQVNVTTSSGPIYIPRRKPFLLPRVTRLGSSSKQQAIQTSAVVELRPKLFVDTQPPKLAAPQPSLISVSQPSMVSTPQLVIQVISGPQTPINTTFETSTIEMPVPNADGSTTLTGVPTQQVPTVTVSPPNASPVAVKPFGSKPEGMLETEPTSPLQEKLKLELNPKPAQEQDRHPEAESVLKSTPSSFKSDQASYPIKMKPYITFMPVLDSVSIKDTTVPPFLKLSNINQGSTTETPSKVEPVAGTVETPLISTNLSSVNADTLLPIINTTSQTPVVTEIQPTLVNASELQLTEMQVITAPRIVIPLITDLQQPLNPVSALYHPDVTSDLLNRTTDLQLPTPLLSTLNTPTVSEINGRPKTESAFNVTDPEITVESEFLPQLEPQTTTQIEPESTTQPGPESTTQPEPIPQPELEPTTQPEPEPTTQPEPQTTAQLTFQSLPNSTTPEQIPYAVKIKLKGKELVDQHTTVDPLTHRGDAIAEPSFTFETPANATNQILVTAKSQPIGSALTQPTTSQPPVMTTSLQPEVTTTLQESVVITNNQPKAVSVPEVIIQLTMRPQPFLSAAPQLSVSPGTKPLSVTATSSRITEDPQIADQPGLFSVSEVSDSKSELATPQESKQDAQPNSESHFESETTFEPEVEISSKPYSYPVKLRPQISFVAELDSAWKHVVLKPQPAVLSPLLPRPNPIRELDYVRPTPAPFISTSNTIWQPNYGRYKPSTTQNSIIRVTQNTIEVPSNNVSTSKRLESLDLDFICNEGNGYYTVDNECDTYILCQQHTATKFSCPAGLFFNPAAKYDEYPCSYPSEVQCIDSTGKLTEQLGNEGIGYYGTSNVHYQEGKEGRSQSIPISTTTDSLPSTTKSAPPTVDVPKISQVNVLTSSGPIYIPRRKPFLLPRLSRPGSGPNQQATQTSAAVELQPKLFGNTQPPKLAAPQPSLISVSQPSMVSAPQSVIKVISGPQTPINTTLETSTVKMPVDIVSPTLAVVPALQVPTVAVSQPNASPVAVQPKKEAVSFKSNSEGILETDPMYPPQSQLKLQTKPELNPASTQEQDPQLEKDFNLKSTPSFFKSNQVSYPIKMRPYITFVPVLDSVSVEEPDTTVPPFLNITDINQFSTTKIPPKVEPVAGTAEKPSIATNVSSVNTVTLLPINNTNPQPPAVTEIQPPLVTVPTLPLTETPVIKVPRKVIQLITDPQLPLNPVSAINQPDVTSIQLIKTTDLQVLAPLLSTLNTPIISGTTDQPKSESALNGTDSKIIVKSEFVPQPEPEPTTPSEPTTQLEPELTTTEPETTAQPTFHSKPNLPMSEQILNAVKTELKGEELIEIYTTVPLLTHGGSTIAEPSFTFETPVNARNQTLVTAKSQPIESASTQPATNQLPVMTTSPPPEATTTVQESVVLANNQPQAVSASQVIIQLMMPPQPSLSAAPQLPLSPAPKPSSVIASNSRISEAPQKANQFELLSVSEVTGSKSELATSQESKQDARPNLELATHLESKTTLEPKVEISYKPYSYPVTLRPQVSFVAESDSAWKHMAFKPQPAVLPPLLPRPNPIREPAYGRYSQSTTQYPITLSPHYVPKVSPIIKPTQAPFISTPSTIWRPNYSRYTPFTTQNPIIIVTQNTTEVPSNNKSTSKQPGSFNLDFVCDKGNGYYTVNNECDTYILCQQRKATKFSCPDGLHFNPAVKYNEYPCVYPSEVQCISSTGKQYTRPTVTGTRQCPKQYGLFSMNDGDCSKYIMCNIGVATVMNCPAGLVFNPSTESCDWLSNVPQCKPKVFKDYTCPDPSVDKYGVATDIIYKYKYRNQCTQYIACQRGFPRLLSCERGLAFDEESQSCISAIYVKNCASYAA